MLRFPVLPAVLLLCVGLVSDAFGQFASPEKRDWSADWIWRSGEPYGNAWMSFRKTFDLSDKPAEAIANIAVDSKYWLWVNGQMVVRDGGLKRGPTPSDTYYDVVDLADYLEAGTNTVAVLVWYWGRSAFSHVDSGKGGLLFEANIDGMLLKSDGSWKARRHPAFGWTDAPVPNHRLSEYNVEFDARNGMPGWMNPNFDAGSWPAAVVQGRPPGGPWHRLYDRLIPQLRDSGLQPYEDAPALPYESTGDTLVVKLPYAAQVTPYFRIEAPEGMTIDMRTDQYYTLSIDRVTKIYSVRSEYITRSGEQEFETPAWMSGEAVRYHFPAGVRVLDVKYRETSYDADFEGWFTSSDDFLDRLWIKARRTIALSMRGYLMETPDRERKQGTGDATVALLSALYSFDRRIDPLLEKYWSELEAWRRADGVFLSGVPGDWGLELAQPNLYSFGDLGIWNYYLITGDAETIRALYPAIRSYLLLWKMQPNGLVAHRESDWNWYDWGVNIDEPLIENAWYYLALSGAVKMARLAGQVDDLPVWKARMDQIKEAYNRVLWTGDRYHTEGQYGEPDDRGNALAVLAGFPTDEMRGPLIHLLRTQMHSSPYMENFAEAALFRLGDADAAIARMKQQYCQMVEGETSTLWEFWDPTIGSKAHQFGTGTVRLLSGFVAGIQPTEGGFRRMRIVPMMGSLRTVDAGVPTKFGMVTVRVEVADHPAERSPALRMRVRIPEGTVATVGVPLVPGVLSRIEVGDRIVWQNDSGVPSVSGVNPLDMTLTHVNFEVQPGEWEFWEYLKPPPAQFDDVNVLGTGENGAVIRWKASEELSGTNYVVEERLNEDFESIGTIAGAGSSDGPRDYEQKINEVMPGVHSYRVMARTDDDCYVYSDVVSYEVPMKTGLSASHVYPNPMTDRGQFLLVADEAQRVRVEILNSVGQRVAALLDQYLVPGEQYRLTIDASRLPAGAYAVVATGKRHVSRRFVVVH